MAGAVFIVVLLQSSAVATFTACAGLVGLVVGVVAMVKGGVSWARVSTPRSGLMLTGLSVAALIAAGVSLPKDPPAEQTTGLTTATEAVATPSPTTATPPATPTPTADAVAALVADADPGSAMAVLGSLAVKGRAPKTGYSRAQFGQTWRDTDRNGCDQRNDVLRRDLDVILLKANTRGCVVLKGTLTDRYTGEEVPFDTSADPSAVQIDHVVALSDAWVKGASTWGVRKREDFANDPLNLHSTSSWANESKGNGDAATWLPPRGTYRCTYIGTQVAVKAKYGLWVTPAERSAAAEVLSSCPGKLLPRAHAIKLGGAPIQKLATSTDSSSSGSSNSGSGSGGAGTSMQKGVHPGAWCAPRGASGHTSKGTLMQCTEKAGEDQPRWRAA